FRSCLRVPPSAPVTFLRGLNAPGDKDVGSNQRPRGGAHRPNGRERFPHRSEDFDYPSQGPISFVAHVGASRGGELGTDEHGSIVGDVLDHAEPPHAPSRSGEANTSVRCNDSGIYFYRQGRTQDPP